MKQKLLRASAAAVLAISPIVVGISAQPLQDEVPLPAADRFATQSVMWDLILERSKSIRAAREHCDDCYIDHGGSAEVMIGLLGMGGSATTDSLLNLLTLQLDAGLAESRSCEFAKRGARLVPALKTLDSAKASQWCQTSFKRLRQNELAAVKDVSMEQICRPQFEIETDRKEWITALQSGRDLLGESGPC